MTAELARAALALVLVLGIPGYPWARVLWASRHWAETYALTLALSLLLVPAAALGLELLLGPGVTLAVALAAIVLVAGAGAVTYRRLGAATAEQLPLPATPPHLPGWSLPPLASVGALILLPMLGWSAGSAAPLAILVLLAATGILAASSGTRIPAPAAGVAAEPNGTAEDSHEGAPRGGRWSWHDAALCAVLVGALVRGYSGPAVHDWPFIRGQDVYAHAAMTQFVMRTGSAQEFLVYPPGFHTLSALLARVSGLDPLRLYAAAAPALMLLPPLGCYTLGRRLFGATTGFAAALFAGLLLASPWYFVRDGTYVDLIAAEFLLVLFVAALGRFLVAPGRRAAVLVGLLGSAVVLYHSVATLQLALLLAVVGLAYLPYLRLRDRRRAGLLVGALSLLGALSLIFVWDAYDVPGTVRGLLGFGGGSGASEHGAMAIGTQAPHALAAMPKLLSPPVAWLGLLGLLLLLPRLRQAGWSARLQLALLPVWCALFFLASRTSLSGFPLRFTRDLGIPLAVLGGYAFVSALRSVQRRSPLSAISAVVLALVVGVGVVRGLSVAARPSTQLFLSPGFAQAGAWLREHNEGGNIVVSPHLNQVPANAMLAMGGYAGLPSYTAVQLRNPRVVPTRDKPEVRDVLRVVRHPADPRTARILETRDVRFVVLYKRFPPRTLWRGKHPVDWRAFERERRLYAPAYQNADVLILRVR